LKEDKITHIGDLKQDPKNARRHGERNIGMIVNSLQEVGAARSIVIDEDGVILAGNGVVEAAGTAGIENVKVVEADGNTIIAVRRVGLTPEQKTKLSLYDNRAGELAGWDSEVLGILKAEGVDFTGLWSEEELARLLEEQVFTELDSDELPDEFSPSLKITIDFETEEERAEVLSLLGIEDTGERYSYADTICGRNV
jgi:ParB-like chromosome segregation protein Spo0J